jgi:hypothetical protein
MTAAGLVTNVPLSGTAILYPVDVTPKGFFGTTAMLVYPNATQIGQFSAPLIATLSNYQSTPVTVNSITMPSQFRIVSGPATTCTNGAVLPPAAANGTPTTCTVAIQFVPTAPGMMGFLWFQNATFNLSGSQNINPPLILFGMNSNSAISGTGGFGNQQVGTTSGPHVITYTNSGATAVTIGATGATLTGNNPGNYTLVNNLCAGVTVAAGGNCTVGVTFTPSATGNRPATLNVNDGVANQTFGLNGTGVQAAVSFTGPAPAMNGGGLSTKNGTITVHNTGTAALTLSSTVAPTIAKVSGSGTGTATIQSGGSCALGTAVAAGGTCTISVRWVPTNTNTANLAVTITDTGAATPAQTSAAFSAN